MILRISGLFLVMCFALCISCGGKRIEAPDWDIDEPVVGSFVEGGTEYDGRLQVIAYNVERGFFWEDVVEYIEARRSEVPATVVLLSEVDRNHSRTDEVFVPREMAKALGMNWVYATEFIEYNDETPENQGDHGNAILSPFPLEEISVVRHAVIWDWSKLGEGQDEPRFGNRVTIGADVVLPDGDRVRVYTAHLESNADTFGKWIQMHEILVDMKSYQSPTVIGGDFNELPGFLMFWKFPFYGIKNSFPFDLSPTGGCSPAGDRARCLNKIDWIVHKDLELIESRVDYPLNDKGGILSDHAPVWAVYEVRGGGEEDGFTQRRGGRRGKIVYLYLSP